MKNYRILDLPAHPLKDSTILDDIIIKGYAVYEPEDILSTEILTKFNQVNVTPTFCMLFGQNNFCNNPDGSNAVAHTDITRISSYTWKPIVCGVNWELNQNENKFYWLDMGSLRKHYPEVHSKGYLAKQKEYDLLSGISYGPSRRMPGFIEGSTIIESVELTGPTLVRTNVPHIVTYNSPNKIRYSLSVRFKETWNTWEEAVLAFNSITK